MWVFHNSISSLEYTLYKLMEQIITPQINHRLLKLTKAQFQADFKVMINYVLGLVEVDLFVDSYWNRKSSRMSIIMCKSHIDCAHLWLEES